MTNAAKLAGLVTTASVSGQALIANSLGNVFTGVTTMTGVLNVDNNIVLTQPANADCAIEIPIIYNTEINQRRKFTGTNWKHLGFFQHRADGQYLDVKTNITSNSCMYMFHAFGYLYNSGNLVSWAGGYTYTPPNSILNQFQINSGNCSITTYRTASPSTGGYLCLRVNRNNSGYSEGMVSIFFHAHDTSTQNSVAITAFAQNNSASNFYTS